MSKRSFECCNSEHGCTPEPKKLKQNHQPDLGVENIGINDNNCIDQSLTPLEKTDNFKNVCMHICLIIVYM